jgi:hypothetical protein
MGAPAGVVVRHLPALHRVVGVAEHVVDETLERQAPEQRRAKLPVAGEQPVLLPHGECGADDGRLFAQTAHVKTDAPLALQGRQALVQEPRFDHVPVDEAQIVPRKLGIVLRGKRAVVTQRPNDFGGRALHRG